MRCLNSAEIFALHKFIANCMGTAVGIRDHGLLFSLCEKPKASFGGIELYSGIFMKAAVLMEAIIDYHVFIDGNKRTGWMATYTFLKANGYKLRAKKQDAFRFVISIAEKKFSIADISVWLQKHSKKI